MGKVFRIGQGFDVHRFAEDRPLILGGVIIPFEKGLAGHSDADVLLHALIDALLGAAGLPDIGMLFPDSEQKYENIDSSILLEQAWQRVIEKGWSLVNADCTILAERPKIGPYKNRMKSRIAEILQVSPEQINIKATTMEKMGFVGHEEGLAALAVVLLEKRK
jgi:2-C-methyl-D-erythritol 2,4-cyclodiphosphate synthase (EC 4.6.1.12)